ncbi:MAG: 16S rRNA (adenine(1518)-N(6)/adenine(1519)-N(6))-dimethyltransferase RsmA [Patescibacteria group bacterium]
MLTGIPKPKRHRGQNFLIDKNILRKIIDVAAIRRDEIIVEIGAGTGILTEALAQRAKKVIAVELDKGLIPVLQKNIQEYPNVEIVQDNCLDIPLERYGKADSDYAVVANIPYNITSRLIRIFLEGHPQPSRMILLVQREVVDRMCAKPPHMNLLALAVQYYADVRRLFDVSRHCFSPKPSVKSAVVSIVPNKSTLVKGDAARTALHEKTFFKLISAAFKGKRKKLASTLFEATHIPKKDIEAILIRLHLSSSARGQELSLEQWLALTHELMLSPLP